MSLFADWNAGKSWTVLLLAVALLTGVFLRVKSFEKLPGAGLDETLYGRYVQQINKGSIREYPRIFDLYIADQEASPLAFLPPSRVTFLVAAALSQRISGASEVEALRAVSRAASIGLLLLSAVFAWRLGGRTASLGVTTLMAVAPLQIHLAHLALIDGFFAMLALLAVWFLWESLQKPGSRRWLWLYGGSLALLVLTKENAAFVWLTICGLLAANRWLKFGKISRPLLAATVLGPVLGVVVLILCAGGIHPLLTTFQLNVSKSYDLPYAILTGDGPWFRYLSDLLLVSPAALIFAIGGAFLCDGKNKPTLYLLGFVVISYLFMCNLRYGMNLRYASMWDFPLRWLAMAPILRWAEGIGSIGRRRVFLVGSVGLLSLFELANYLRIFVVHQVFDPVPAHLMRALDMIK